MTKKKRVNKKLEIYATVHTMVLSFVFLSVLAVSIYLVLYGLGWFVYFVWLVMVVGLTLYKMQYIKQVEQVLLESERDTSRLEDHDTEQSIFTEDERDSDVRMMTG